MSEAAHGEIDSVYRSEARRVLATLVRLLGGFDAAEEGLHEAFAAAAVSWPRDGVPRNPYSWLVSTGRNRVIDRWRRDARLAAHLHAFPAEEVAWPDDPAPEAIADDELRLIFTCCHPDLSPDGAVALTLREVCRLTTEEIARAFLVTAPTVAQRIVRAKAKIRDLAIPYEVPERAEWPNRLARVLQVIYLVFNEGYTATDGPDLIRVDLCREAIRLGRLLAELSEDAETLGLLALMLLHDSRRETRTDGGGDLVSLEDQDRGRWNRELITEAQGLIERALKQRQAGPYLLQAAIVDLHARAPDIDSTDWAQIVGLYDALLRIDPSPVAALNRAVAVAQRDGPAFGLAAVAGAMAGGQLDNYHLAFVALANMHNRLGEAQAAKAHYERALQLASQPAEKRFVQLKIAGIGTLDA